MNGVRIVLMLLAVLEVVVALLMIVVILMQQSKAGGGLGAIGGEATESIVGAGAGNVLTRTTVILAAIFLGTTLCMAVITGRLYSSSSVAESLVGPQSVPELSAPEEPAEEGAEALAEDAPVTEGDEPQAVVEDEAAEGEDGGEDAGETATQE
jgi:preprotein translocase subunit SecG